MFEGNGEDEERLSDSKENNTSSLLCVLIQTSIALQARLR